MLRVEFVIAGLILLCLGLALGAAGYVKIQPTIAEELVGFTEQLSGQKAPAELKPPKTEGYVLRGVGGAAFFSGLALVLKSRKD